jgi:TPP-dependent indolepyruvate ferredoxin oxidoreductase alpha subunit
MRRFSSNSALEVEFTYMHGQEEEIWLNGRLLPKLENFEPVKVRNFFGEGILAVTKALLQSGVSYVGGYQGAPISHLMDVLGDAKEILDELGVHFENSASEATAAASLAASVYYPLRGAITFKSTVLAEH